MGNVPFLVYNLRIPRFLRSFVGWVLVQHENFLLFQFWRNVSKIFTLGTFLSAKCYQLKLSCFNFA